MTTLSVLTAKKITDLAWKQSKLTWDDLADWFANPGSKKDAGGGWVLGEFTDGVRRNTNCVHRSAIVLDADHAEPGLPKKVKALGVTALMATTWSHQPDAPRWRVVILPDRPMTATEYEACALVLMHRLGVDQFDPVSARPAQFMWRPATAHPDWYEWHRFDGAPALVSDLLLDSLTLPEPETGRAQATKKRDPFTIEGPIGAFNRVYADLNDLIAAYDLPYESAGEQLWRLTGSHSQAGMGPIPGRAGLWFSNHATDEAWGQAVTAFDLVRIHHWGHLDSGRTGAPVNRLPSYKATLDEITTDDKVRGELLGIDFQPEDPDPDPDWRLGLTMNSKGIPHDTVGNWDLIAANDPVFCSITRDAMRSEILFNADPPWRSITDADGLTDADRFELQDYVERTYRLPCSRARIDSRVETTAQRWQANPLRDWLLDLQWDGKARLEFCLPGVEVTPYTRLVARKALVAAVARVLSPGIKWDHTLVLYGLEGLGKTRWVDAMATNPRYRSELGDIRLKDTVDGLHRSWIVTADEGQSMRRADQAHLKEFLSRTHDTYRPAYARTAGTFPRQCVIWATTNDEQFLIRQEGNRRFLIVRCDAIAAEHLFDPAWIEQVWAEAVQLWRAGEPLWLSPEESRIAAVNREDHIEDDPLLGRVIDFLATPVPEDREEQSQSQRMLWRESLAEGMTAPGKVALERVCVLDIWHEVLGETRGRPARWQSAEITAVLRAIPGWVSGGTQRTIYGPQRVYCRARQ